MNKYIRQLFGIMFQSQQTQLAIHTQAQHPSMSSEEWRTRWQEKGFTWRTEPEINLARQEELSQRRAIVPDIEKGIYPFKGMKLERADVEWLLATHENGRGPVDWSDVSQRERSGLDVRGADLRQEDLYGLPLACLQAGLDGNEWVKTSRELHMLAAVHLEGANLALCHLEGAHLGGAYLEGADFSRAHLMRADFYRAHLEGVSFSNAHLEGASLRSAFLDNATSLFEVTLGNKEFGFVLIAHINWSTVNLSVVNWAQVKELGDEHEAKQPNMWFGQEKNRDDRIRGYQRAVYANRQLATALQDQGLNEDASRFAYRSHKLQRIVLRRQKKFGQYLFSLFLDLLAGYGYRPGRSVIWYLVTIFGFALAYSAIGHLPFFPDSFVFSLTSFHGRGFFPGLGNAYSLHNPLVVIAAIEAVIGLLIEISFIATFNQRFFGK